MPDGVHLIEPTYWITADGEGFGETDEGEPPADAIVVGKAEWLRRLAEATPDEADLLRVEGEDENP